MIHAKLAVTLRLRPITRQSSPNHVLTHTTTRACVHANLAFNTNPETGSIPGYRYLNNPYIPHLSLMIMNESRFNYTPSLHNTKEKGKKNTSYLEHITNQHT